MEPKYAPQLLLESLPGKHWSAIGQFFPLYLVTVTDRFAKVTRPNFLPSKMANDRSGW